MEVDTLHSKLGIIRFGNGIGIKNTLLACIYDDRMIHYADGTMVTSHNVSAQTFYQAITKTSLESALVRSVIERDAADLIQNHPQCQYVAVYNTQSLHRLIAACMARHAELYLMNSWNTVPNRISYAYRHLKYR